MRIRVNSRVVVLNHDTKLFPHHVDPSKSYDFSAPTGEISRHPTDPSIWGIKNLSERKWVSSTVEGKLRDIEPGKSVPLAVGTKIQFGSSEGEIRF